MIAGSWQSDRQLTLDCLAVQSMPRKLDLRKCPADARHLLPKFQG